MYAVSFNFSLWADTCVIVGEYELTCFAIHCVKFSQNRVAQCSCEHTFCMTEYIERDILGCLEITYLAMQLPNTEAKEHNRQMAGGDCPKTG